MERNALVRGIQAFPFAGDIQAKKIIRGETLSPVYREGVSLLYIEKERHSLLSIEKGSISSLYRRSLTPLYIEERHSLLCIEK